MKTKTSAMAAPISSHACQSRNAAAARRLEPGSARLRVWERARPSEWFPRPWEVKG